MFSRKNYPKMLSDINLSDDQKERFCDAIDQLMTVASIKSNRIKDELSRRWYAGESNAYNMIWHFINGTLDEQDVFHDADGNEIE